MITDPSFGKVFASMYRGSMVGAGSVKFAVMGYAIANMRPGTGEDAERLYVEINPKLLAAILGDPQAEIEAALEYLTAADAGSRTKDQEGRRLVAAGPFVYWVVNGRHYRALGAVEARRRQWSESKKRQRARKRQTTERERRFGEALANGDQERADGIAAEGLPG